MFLTFPAGVRSILKVVFMFQNLKTQRATKSNLYVFWEFSVYFHAQIFSGVISFLVFIIALELCMFYILTMVIYIAGKDFSQEFLMEQSCVCSSYMHAWVFMHVWAWDCGYDHINFKKIFTKSTLLLICWFLHSYFEVFPSLSFTTS